MNPYKISGPLRFMGCGQSEASPVGAAVCLCGLVLLIPGALLVVGMLMGGFSILR